MVIATIPLTFQYNFMKELLTKISRYNLFNYLLTGSVFVISSILVLKPIYILSVQENIAIFLFASYFVGSVLSRIGSLCVEPLLKKIKFITFADYKEFLEVQKIDPTISDLSEENNIYRTYVASFLILLILVIAKKCSYIFLLTKNTLTLVIIISLSLIFLFAYKKQTAYIKKRIDNQKTK